jgi:hypothetical protein
MFDNVMGIKEVALWVIYSPSVGLARALEMKRQRARYIRGLYHRHNSWYSRTVTKKVVDELVTRKGCGVVAMTLK